MTKQKQSRAEHTPIRWLYPFDYPIIAYLLATLFLSRRFSFKIDWQLLTNFDFEITLILGAGLPVFVLWYAKLVVLDRLRLPQIWRVMRNFCKNSLLNWRRMYEILRTTLAFKVCMLCYSIIKQSIPVINPTMYDRSFVEMDRVVHFGFNPVALSELAATSPLVMSFFDQTYVLWYLVKSAVLLFFLFYAAQQKRWHFFTAYFLVWMLGGALAVALPSLGPVFCNPQDYLHVDMPRAKMLQGYLWAHYTDLLKDPSSYTFQIYEGVAAFPSLHVGIAVLNAIAISSIPFLRNALLAYALIIQAGSVILGWHYAIDGYACAALAVVIYRVLGSFFREESEQACATQPKT